MRQIKADTTAKNLFPSWKVTFSFKFILTLKETNKSKRNYMVFYLMSFLLDSLSKDITSLLHK